MVETDVQTTGSQPPKDETLQQASDALPMSDMSNPEATQDQAATEAASSTVPAVKEAVSPAPAAHEKAPKGKDKDGVKAPSEKQRDGDSLSIGPSDAQPGVSSGNSDPLICTITLLLPTGARHPYKIDEKYLAKRNVEVPDVTESGKKDPFSISVYKLKELILREWREEWEGKPASPSSIRLIFFGKLLDDKEQLKSASLPFSSARRSTRRLGTVD